MFLLPRTTRFLVTVSVAAVLLVSAAGPASAQSVQVSECVHSQSSALGRIIQSQSETVQTIADRAFKYYQDRCTLLQPKGGGGRRCDTEELCSLKQCESVLSHPPTSDGDLCGVVSEHFGHENVTTFNGSCEQECQRLNLNFAKSVIVYSNDPGPDLALEACWTQQLDAVFREVAANHSVPTQPHAALRWQYVGTSSGLMRAYPGVARRRCVFDPRVRPWYVAASSGPISVVILMDVSASMVKYKRLSRSIEVAKNILGSLTNFDNVGIVLFGSSARTLQLNGSDVLVKSTIENVNKLKGLLDSDISLMGSTGYYEGFRKAFSLLNSTDVQEERNGTCPSIIVLLTDGIVSSQADEDQEIDDLVTNIQTWNRGEGGQKKAFIFAYAVGGYVEMNLPKAVACRNAGVFGHIEEGNTFTALNQYYSFLATLAIETNPVWVEPYEDAFGLGLVTTVSVAIHDHSFNPPKLIGVVGVDVRVSDLREADRENWEQTIQCLAAQVKCPQRINLTECEIHFVRISSGVQSDLDLQCDFLPGNCSESGNSSINATMFAGSSGDDSYCSNTSLQLNICPRYSNRSLEEEICCPLSPLTGSTCEHINADTSLFLASNVHINPPDGAPSLAASNIYTLLAVLISFKLIFFVF